MTDNPERATWRHLIRNSLPEHRRTDFDQHQFIECAACAAKPGSPMLCAPCLANRQNMAELNEVAALSKAVVDTRKPRVHARPITTSCPACRSPYDGTRLWGLAHCACGAVWNPSVPLEDQHLHIDMTSRSSTAVNTAPPPPTPARPIQRPETTGPYSMTTMEVADEGDKVRIRIRESHGKASIYLKPDELDQHALDCIRLAEKIRSR